MVGGSREFESIRGGSRARCRHVATASGETCRSGAFATIRRHALRMLIALPRRPRASPSLSAAVALGGCGSDASRTRSLKLVRMPAAEPVDRSRNAARSRCRRTARKPDGRKIKIFAAVLPANTLSPKDDPLLILAGGPGQAASTLAPFASRLNEVRRTRDVVLIDQRGTGRSSPLDCAAFKPARRRCARDRSGAARAAVRRAAARARRRRRAVHDDRVDRRPRGDARRRWATRAGTCGAAATARASRRNTCAAIRSACAR